MRLQGRGAGSHQFFQTGFQVQIADQPVEIVRMQTEQFGRFDIIAGGLFDGVNDGRFLRLLDSVVILRWRCGWRCVKSFPKSTSRSSTSRRPTWTRREDGIWPNRSAASKISTNSSSSATTTVSKGILIKSFPSASRGKVEIPEPPILTRGHPLFAHRFQRAVAAVGAIMSNSSPHAGSDARTGGASRIYAQNPSCNRASDQGSEARL